MKHRILRFRAFGLVACLSLCITACMTSNGGESDRGADALSGVAALGKWTPMGSLTGLALSSVRNGEFAFPNDSTGFLCLGDDAKTDRKPWLRTQDAGVTWATFEFDTTMSLESLYGFGNSVVMGQADFFRKNSGGNIVTIHRVLKTNTAGADWEFLTVEGDSSLDAFEAQSNGVLWVKKSKVKYFSLDTAKTWKKFTPGPTVTSHLGEAGYYVLDEYRGAGAYFTSILSFDLSKDTYAKKAIAGVTQIQDMAMNSGGWGMAGGYAINSGTGTQIPALAQTRDGKEWQVFLGEGQGFLFTVALLGGKTAMAIGVSGATSLLNYRSEDGGLSWKKVPSSGQPMLLGISCPLDSVCFGIAFNSTVLKYSRN